MVSLPRPDSDFWEKHRWFQWLTKNSLMASAWSCSGWGSSVTGCTGGIRLLRKRSLVSMTEYEQSDGIFLFLRDLFIRFRSWFRFVGSLQTFENLGICFECTLFKYKWVRKIWQRLHQEQWLLIATWFRTLFSDTDYIEKLGLANFGSINVQNEHWAFQSISFNLGWILSCGSYPVSCLQNTSQLGVVWQWGGFWAYRYVPSLTEWSWWMWSQPPEWSVESLQPTVSIFASGEGTWCTLWSPCSASGFTIENITSAFRLPFATVHWSSSTTARKDVRSAISG